MKSPPWGLRLMGRQRWRPPRATFPDTFRYSDRPPAGRTPSWLAACPGPALLPGGSRMELVVWTSQGAKWDTLWANYINPLNPGTTDIIGLLVEAGWGRELSPGSVDQQRLRPGLGDRP